MLTYLSSQFKLQLSQSER